MRLAAILTVFMALLSSHVSAANYAFQGASRGGIGSLFWAKNNFGVQFTYDGVLNLDVLLGEPIVGIKARWQVLDTSTVEVPIGIDQGKWALRKAYLGELGSDAGGQIALIGVKLEFAFSHPDLRDRVYGDVGVLGRGDGSSWSYNTPGSPDWKKLLYRGSVAFGGPTAFLSETETKGLWRSGLTLEEVRIVKGETNIRDLQTWYWNSSGLAEIAALETSAKKMAEDVYRAYGYSALRKAEIETRLARLRDRHVTDASRLPSVDELRGYRAGLAALDRTLKTLPRDLTDTLKEQVYVDITRRADADLRRAISRAKAQVSLAERRRVIHLERNQKLELCEQSRPVRPVQERDFVGLSLISRPREDPCSGASDYSACVEAGRERARAAARREREEKERKQQAHREELARYESEIAIWPQAYAKCQHAAESSYERALAELESR